MSTSPASLVPIPATITNIKVETSNVTTYYIKLPAGLDLPKPGQFDMLYIHGVGEVPISVSDIDRERRVVAHTVRFVGSVTYAFTKLREGYRRF